MIEKTILTYLKTELTVPVYIGESPGKKPSEYVVLKVVDGGRENFIDSITFFCESYSTSLVKAAELNEKLKAAMYAAISLDDVSSVKCGGGGQNIETATKTYCYEAVFNLYYTEGE